jgi:hypothetical protein
MLDHLDETPLDMDELTIATDVLMARFTRPTSPAKAPEQHTVDGRNNEAPKPRQPSTARTFMQTRPGGPLQAMQHEMKVLERSVTTKRQKQGPTSTVGREVLDLISQTTANNNKENTRPKTKRNKKPAPPAPKTQRKKKKAKLDSAVSVVDPEPAVLATPKQPTCTYGCVHGGLVALLQMAPYDTKYGLKQGNYMHGKNCVDCDKAIGELFDLSNSKALFYYCVEDYKVAELEDANTDIASKACGCILCITCYYKREAKKNSTRGGARRSSGRGKVSNN